MSSSGAEHTRPSGRGTVLAVSYTAMPGGAERVLGDHLTAFGDEVWLACPEGELARTARAMGVRVFPLRERSIEARTSIRRRLSAPLALAGFTRELRRLVRSLRPDVVVAWGMRPGLACAALRPAPRFVLQHNDLMPGGSFDRLVRRAARRAARVVAPSRAIARDLDPGGELGNDLRVIHPGVDLERFAPAPLPEQPAALYLGAIIDWKRPDLAVEIAERAGIPLTIAGAPLDAAGERLEAGLRERAGPLVEFAGRVADPRDALREASALLHCADREPYGMALVEALACGRPVVAPDSGGPAEIVDATCGRLYPPGDAQAGAAALLEAVGDRELAAAARRRAEAEFDLERSRRDYAMLIGALSDRGRDRGAGLALVTVLHDSEPDVRRLIASVERHLPEAHLVAVDSGSSEDDAGAELVRDSSLRTTVIELDNVGYGRGSNRGVEAVEEPVTAILNPDVELLDASLAELAAEVARADGAERILAPLVVLPGGARQDSVHPPPLSAPEAMTALVPAGALPRPLRLRAQPWRADRPRRAGWAVGCCIAARTDTLRRLGPFDATAFMYAEDMELGMRAAREGVETWFWPEARVLHHQAQSAGRAFGGEPHELLARRRREVIRDARGKRAQAIDDALQLVTVANRIALKTLLRRPAGRERERLRAIRQARREPGG